MENSTRPPAAPATVAREEQAGGVSVVYLVGPLRWPVSPELRRRVEALIARGERTILLDLAGVEAIDAAGVGELVQLHTLVASADGELWIDNPGPKARALLERAGLLELLSLDWPFGFEKCS